MISFWVGCQHKSVKLADVGQCFLFGARSESRIRKGEHMRRFVGSEWVTGGSVYGAGRLGDDIGGGVSVNLPYSNTPSLDSPLSPVS